MFGAQVFINNYSSNERKCTIIVHMYIIFQLIQWEQLISKHIFCRYSQNSSIYWNVQVLTLHGASIIPVVVFNRRDSVYLYIFIFT